MMVLWLLVGVAILAVTAFDVFQTVIVPRPIGRKFRPSGFLSRNLWRGWTGLGRYVRSGDAREDYLGTFAPFLLVTLLGFWVLSLVMGYASIFFALSAQIKPVPNAIESLYFAGTSLLTLGFGHFEATHGAARMIVLCAGASGLSTFAIVTAFLFPIVGSYQQRETFVVTFINRAGAPPSGIQLLETHARLGLLEGLDRSLRQAEVWMAEVLETHLAYPILAFFRSTHDDISWLAVLGTILDTSTLVLTTIDTPKTGQAQLVQQLGRHLVVDFARYFKLEPGGDAGIGRPEFDAACDRLDAAGLPLRERERAWKDFAAMRATYASQLVQMVAYWQVPRTPWFERRSPNESR